MKLKVGMVALELLVEIVKSHKDIDLLTFAKYKPTLSFQSRVAKRIEDYIKNSSENADLSIVKQRIITEERLSHDLDDEFNRRHTVSVESFSKSYLEQTVSNLQVDQVLAICSICKMKDGRISHIPMMDFACEINPENLELVQLLIKYMGLKGAILDSGNSYHFYGFDLLAHSEWLKLMAKFLLSVPLTDLRYIAHRILGETCVLRITPSSQKPKIPVVEAIVTD